MQSRLRLRFVDTREHGVVFSHSESTALVLSRSQDTGSSMGTRRKTRRQILEKGRRRPYGKGKADAKTLLT